MLSGDITLWKSGPFIFQNNVDFSEHISLNRYSDMEQTSSLSPSIAASPALNTGLLESVSAVSGASLSEGHVVPHSSRPHSLNTNTDELPVGLMCVSLDRGKKHEPTQTHGEREDSTQRGLRPRNHTCNLC